MIYGTQLAYTRKGSELVCKFPNLLPGTELVREMEAQYGELVWCLAPQDAPWTPNVCNKLKLSMGDFDGTKDWLLCLGNPVLLSLMTVIAADTTEELRFLQWRADNDSRNLPSGERPGSYRPLTIRI